MTKNQVEEILKTVPFKEKRNPNNRDFEMELIGCSYLCENDKIYIVYDEKLRVTDLNYGYTEFSR